jgi:hypothetical protein
LDKVSYNSQSKKDESKTQNLAELRFLAKTTGINFINNHNMTEQISPLIVISDKKKIALMT